MCSYAVDFWLDDIAVLTDADALIELMRAAAEAGQAEVLGQSAHHFPNGAVTAVLVLSQSHLSVHTWPEHGAANFDLLTCGRLNGELMLTHLERVLRPKRVNVTRVIRDIL
jgi:S-adenosylmethionine decarboxylase